MLSLCIGMSDLLKFHFFSPAEHSLSLLHMLQALTDHPWVFARLQKSYEGSRVETSDPLQSFSKTGFQAWLLKLFVITAFLNDRMLGQTV